jgi:mRNA-degrading endonuclease toxin of MazEF toxin-antitoxin module
VLIKLDALAGKGSGLLADSVVITDNLATIAEIAAERNIGYLPMKEIDQALKHTLGL